MRPGAPVALRDPDASAAARPPAQPAIIRARDFSLFYGSKAGVEKIALDIFPRCVTAIIGPSGCGKSTLLRCFNRMNDLIPGVRTAGTILLDGVDIHGASLELTVLRKRVGMVFQRPNPFPLSILDNLTYGLRVHGAGGREDRLAAAESSLRATLLWDALKDKLHEPALHLSAEQQQRLCISRLVAMGPEVLLMDEPCSALDPIATERIEDLMRELAGRYTIVIVTHNMQQAARVSQESGFMLLGELVEFGQTQKIFTKPADRRTEDYVTGRYG
jgi:phosphate transport system ATP-binding protein